MRAALCRREAVRETLRMARYVRADSSEPGMNLLFAFCFVVKGPTGLAFLCTFALFEELLLRFTRAGCPPAAGGEGLPGASGVSSFFSITAEAPHSPSENSMLLFGCPPRKQMGLGEGGEAILRS